MSAPYPPRADASREADAQEQGANDDGALADAVLTSPPTPPASGWDPYEVWRTRVFAAQPSGYKKDRDNT